MSTTTVADPNDLPPHFVGGTLLIWPPDATVNAVTLGRQVVAVLDAQAAGVLRAEIVLPGGQTITGDEVGALLDRWVGGITAFTVDQADATVFYQWHRFDTHVSFRIAEDDILTVVSDTRSIHPEDLRLIAAGARKALRRDRARDPTLVVGSFGWGRV